MLTVELTISVISSMSKVVLFQVRLIPDWSLACIDIKRQGPGENPRLTEQVQVNGRLSVSAT